MEPNTSGGITGIPSLMLLCLRAVEANGVIIEESSVLPRDIKQDYREGGYKDALNIYNIACGKDIDVSIYMRDIFIQDEKVPLKTRIEIDKLFDIYFRNKGCYVQKDKFMPSCIICEKVYGEKEDYHVKQLCCGTSTFGTSKSVSRLPGRELNNYIRVCISEACAMGLYMFQFSMDYLREAEEMSDDDLA